jgi:hypothetical protein
MSLHELGEGQHLSEVARRHIGSLRQEAGDRGRLDRVAAALTMHLTKTAGLLFLTGLA